MVFILRTFWRSTCNVCAAWYQVDQKSVDYAKVVFCEQTQA